ncbi:peptidylprolyl isomerase [Acholeplasma granularum]|uniref:peptidylprolyl isomerase n=1 Tax=Acholeplasma granularum TaxID=264635 RepID=UPI000470B398|nr:peptidylprolyl isomerase [Acholeplasma granularum]
MKKTLILLFILGVSLILIGCDNKEIENPDDLSNLEYYNYLKDTNPVITITVKDYGVMKAQLFYEVAENTVNNMIDYIADNSYENSSFHRVIKDFMIQGGMIEYVKNPIRGEFSLNGFENDLKHTRGVLSMARTGEVNSATSQFFIVHKETDFLDGRYASFGGLIYGFDVLDKIANLATNSSDSPLNKVIIENITVEYNGYVPKTVIYN